MQFNMEFQFLCFLLFVFMILRIWKKSKAPNLPPGPWKLPLIGNMHLFVGSLPHHCLTDLAKKYGPLMHVQLGELSNIVISSPELAKQVFKNYDINFAQRPIPAAASYLFYNSTDIAFAPYGAYWRQLRKICAMELLSPKRVQSFRSIREEEVANLIRYISSNQGLPINLTKLLFSLTNDITSRAAIGGKCKDREAFLPVLGKMIELLVGFSLVDVFPSIKLLEILSGRKSELERLRQEHDKISDNIIKDHRACMEIEADDDLVNVLLNLQDHGDLDIPLTNENIKNVIFDVFAAGSETTTTTLEWAMAELVKNPRVLEKAQIEVRQVFDGKTNVDEAGLQELEYLKLVIKETLRLHPPAPLIVRECSENCKIDGYEIRVGTTLIVNTWAIGRDPNHWKEPKRFNPKRFLEGSIDYKGFNFEFIPFGVGRRICPGISFAIANVELPLAQLLYHFNWKLPNGQKNEDLDMTEAFRGATQLKNDLYLVPIPHHHVPNE